MAKKRAFVRYTKNGKIIPGSLILTSGSYPQGPSTWNEIPADLCCNQTSSSGIEPLIMEINQDSEAEEFVFGMNTQFTGKVKGTIDWGDGSPLEAFDLPTGDTSYISHSYNSSYNTYTVKVYFTDLSGFSNLELFSGDVVGKVLSVSNLPTVFKDAPTTEQINVGGQQIVSLDVSGLSIDELNAGNCPNLESLNIEGCFNLNNITLNNSNFDKLYFNGLINLKTVGVNDSQNLFILDIAGSIIIDSLDAYGCNLSQGTVDDILAQLDLNGLNNGNVSLDGGTNSSPSVAGLTSKSNLQAKGWTVNTN